jgi:hypothetical protein
VLTRRRTQIQHNRGKAGGLQQQIGRTQGLIQACPRLGASFQLGILLRISAPDPEQLPQRHAIGRSRQRIECVARIHPGTDPALCRAPREERQRKAGPAR